MKFYYTAVINKCRTENSPKTSQKTQVISRKHGQNFNDSKYLVFYFILASNAYDTLKSITVN